MTEALLEVSGLKKHFPIHKGVFSRVSGHVYAVDGVSFTIKRGETLGLVGESGCGKSTVGRTLLKLVEPTGGTIQVAGQDITHLDRAAMLPYRRRLQMIYQDPYASLNPRMTAGEIVSEPMIIHDEGTPAERQERTAALFERVGLRPAAMRSSFVDGSRPPLDSRREADHTTAALAWRISGAAARVPAICRSREATRRSLRLRSRRRPFTDS